MLINEGKLVLYDNIDNLRQSAYMIQGAKEDVDEFCKGKNVIYLVHAITGSKAVIYERFDDNIRSSVEGLKLTLSSVRVEDLCTWLTYKGKEGGLECLWEKAN